MKERVLIFLALALSMVILITSDFGNSSKVMVYDCGVAEWHPDIPRAVREECRRLRKDTNEDSGNTKKSYI